MINFIKNYLERRKNLNLWKDEKRKKWLAEGRNPKEIEKELKLHKIKLFKSRKLK